MIAAAVVPIGLPDCASRGAASCVARRPPPIRSGSVGSGCSDKIVYVDYDDLAVAEQRLLVWQQFAGGPQTTVVCVFT